MKPEIKEQWVAALRSGEYQQGSGKLNKDSMFCCLGVLCDIASKQTDQKITKWIFHPELQWAEIQDLKNKASVNQYDFLPTSVIQWAELEQHGTIVGDVQVKWNPSLEYYDYPEEDYSDIHIEVSDLNDNAVPFSVIADLIEDQL
jgi:hypothetical protein